MKSLAPAALALAIVLGADGALAGSSAEATLGAITVTLTDLDPTDGIAPSIGFIGGASRASAVVFQPFGVYDDDLAEGSGPWADVDAAVALSLGRAAASLDGAGADGSGGVLRASGQAADPGTPLGASVQYQAQAWAPYVAAGSFVLSPRTSVTFSALATLGTTTQSGPSSHDYAIAGAYLFLQGTGDVFSIECESAFDAACSTTEQRLLGVTYANADAGSASGTFQAWVQAAGYSQAAAVPEPTTAILLLAGLGLVYRRTRRGR